MSFKRNILVKNRFTVKRNGKGTIGNTPGNFVRDYMARDNATEVLTPVTKKPIDTFITRYMARGEATEKANSLKDLHQKFKDAQGLGGRAFGKDGNSDRGNVSLSDSAIRALSDKIQRNFDNGKTALEGVISFDGHYLKDQHVAQSDVPLDENGHALKKGAFRGKIDQLKLRMAIMAGFDKMANRKVAGRHRFEDIGYVGVIQVDTKQVHCHFVLTDYGWGQSVWTPHGYETKGKLSDTDKQLIRRGIDNTLDKYQKVKQLTSQITHEKQDTRSFVKRYTQKALTNSSFAQVILASLPDDKRLWRAQSNAKNMKQANNILRFYVKQILKKPNSGYKQAISYVQKYAETRQKKEDLTNQQYQALVQHGEDRIINGCMDAVYGMLKTVPAKSKNTHTAFMDMATNDLTVLANQKMPRDPAIEFSFHLRSYNKRLKKHRKYAKENYEAEQDYLNKQANGQTNEASLAMLRFYQIEGEYQNRLVSKYTTLLPLSVVRNKRWKKMQEDLKHEHDKLIRMQQMMQDPAIMQFANGEDAEEYGKSHYRLRNGELLNQSPSIYDKHFEQQVKKYQQHVADFKEELIMNNRKMGYNKKGEAIALDEAPFKFDEVKMLDLQDTGGDFDNQKVAGRYISDFIQATKIRTDAFRDAISYALKTKQPDIIAQMDRTDFVNMSQTAKDLQKTGELEIKREQKYAPIVKKKTVSADNDLSDKMQQEILTTLRQIDETMPIAETIDKNTKAIPQ